MDEKNLNEKNWARQFEADRPRLTRVAYRMLGSLAEAEDAHEHIAERLVAENLTSGVREHEDETAKRMLVLQVIQPGLAGLMDGSVSTLAPVFAAAKLTLPANQRLSLARGSDGRFTFAVKETN